jgi:ABC-type sugar transport system permease subunit
MVGRQAVLGGQGQEQGRDDRRATTRPAARSRLRAVARCWPEYLCIAPFFVLFAVFFAYPAVWAILLGFQRWDGLTAPRWVGLDNYAFLADDPVARATLFNTVRFLLILAPLGVALPVVLGVLLDVPRLRGRTFFRTALFVPAVTSLVVVGIVWRLLFGSANGWLNGLLAYVGLGPYNWLKEEWLAQVPVVTLTLWGGIGFSTLIVLGGLQAIDPEVYDAAKIDGASGWQTFAQITVPLLRPVIVFLVIASTIATATLFGQPYVVTRGGPSNETLTPLLYVYNTGIGATGAARVGDASALSVLLTVATLAIVLVQFAVLRRGAEA